MDDRLMRSARAARADLQAGRLRGEALRDLVRSLPPHDRDVWVDEALGVPPAPPEPPLPRGAVPYLPAGVDEILAMLDAVPLSTADVFVDLGAGLGRVVILVHLLTGARGHGIELQAPLVDAARALGASLGLTAVTFDHARAEDAALDGSVFFLYAPFNGDMLRRVLARLEDVARRRRIVVCAVGFELHDAAWLAPRTSHHALAVYESRADADPRSPTVR